MRTLVRLQPPRRLIGQSSPWVEFKPQVTFNPDVNVQAPLNIELGGLPLSLGLFLGSGLAFFVRPQLSNGFPKTAALVAGLGLAAGGIANLLLPKKAKASAAPAPGQPAPIVPPGTPTGPSTATPYLPQSSDAFSEVTARVVSPSEASTIDLWPWQRSYPVKISIHNPSSSPATFMLELVGRETSQPDGNTYDTMLPQQVSIGAGQVRDYDISMPMSSWGEYAEIDLDVYKRRVPGEAPERLASRFFVVE